MHLGGEIVQFSSASDNHFCLHEFPKMFDISNGIGWKSSNESTCLIVFWQIFGPITEDEAAGSDALIKNQLTHPIYISNFVRYSQNTQTSFVELLQDLNYSNEAGL